MSDSVYVYVHITPSNKLYFGITNMKPKNRWSGGKGYSSQKLFWRAIQKYGWDNIQHIILLEGLLRGLFYFTIKSRKRKEKQVMQDISNELTQIIHDKQCSPLLAFIVLRDEFSYSRIQIQ